MRQTPPHAQPRSNSRSRTTQAGSHHASQHPIRPRESARSAHQISHRRELAPEVQVARLAAVVRDDVLDRGVADVADGVDDGRRGPGDGTEVVRESEDGPVVRDGAEVGVLAVRELAVSDELPANGDVLAGLVSDTVRLCGCALAAVGACGNIDADVR